MKITEKQNKTLLEYNINVDDYETLDDLLEVLDDKIVCVGLTKNQEFLNGDGLILQKLYDEIYDNN